MLPSFGMQIAKTEVMKLGCIKRFVTNPFHKNELQGLGQGRSYSHRSTNMFIRVSTKNAQHFSLEPEPEPESINLPRNGAGGEACPKAFRLRIPEHKQAPQ